MSRRKASKSQGSGNRTHDRGRSRTSRDHLPTDYCFPAESDPPDRRHAAPVLECVLAQVDSEEEEDVESYFGDDLLKERGYDAENDRHAPYLHYSATPSNRRPAVQRQQPGLHGGQYPLPPPEFFSSRAPRPPELQRSYAFRQSPAAHEYGMFEPRVGLVDRSHMPQPNEGYQSQVWRGMASSSYNSTYGSPTFGGAPTGQQMRDPRYEGYAGASCAYSPGRQNMGGGDCGYDTRLLVPDYV